MGGMFRTRGRRLGTLALAVAAFSVLFPSRPVDAFANQCGIRSNYFDGMFRDDFYEGVSANIVARYSGVCNTDTNALNNFSNAWSMISAGNRNGWIQSGLERGYGTNVRHFSQAYNPGTAYFQTVYGSFFPYGQNHQYWQQYDPACGCVHSNVDVTRFINTPFNPFGHWNQPFSIQLFGETAYRESDILGSPTAKTRFSSIQVQNYANNWLAIPCPFLAGYNDNAARWRVAGVNCTTFDIWTQVP